MKDLTIEKLKYVPRQRKSGRNPKYPFKQMESGDSLYVPNIEYRTLYHAYNMYTSRHNVRSKFVCQPERAGARLYIISKSNTK